MTVEDVMVPTPSADTDDERPKHWFTEAPGKKTPRQACAREDT